VDVYTRLKKTKTPRKTQKATTYWEPKNTKYQSVS